MIKYHELSSLINAFAPKHLTYITLEVDQWMKMKYCVISIELSNINKMFVNLFNITARRNKSKKRFKIGIKKTKVNFLIYQKNTNSGCIFFEKKQNYLFYLNINFKIM